MNEQELFEQLSANDPNLIISALFRLGSERFSVPSSLLLAKVVDLISSTDADVRHRAIFTAGIHWHYLPALSKIIDVLKNVQEDILVLTCAATAAGSLAHEHEAVREHVVLELAKVVSNDKISQDVRDVAYTSALWAALRITPDEYAKRSISNDQIEMDWDWLTAILHRH